MRLALLAGILLGTTLPVCAQTIPPPKEAPSSLLTREEAEGLAVGQASLYEQAKIQEKIAAEDIRIAHAALVPKLGIPIGGLFQTPALGPGNGGAPYGIAANSVAEYTAAYSITGTIDISGNLHAAMERSRALLEAAHAGSLVAKRQLVGQTDEAFYALALATAKRQAAEQNLATAREAESATAFMLKAGEVAGVDGVRSHLVTLGRQDELRQAIAAEEIAAHALKVFIGYDFVRELNVSPLTEPKPGEIEAWKPEAVAQRSEFVQFDAQIRSNQQEAEQARSEMRPQLTYSLGLGFDTNSLALPNIYQHSGVSAGIQLNIPLSDGGASHAREVQADLKQKLVESQKALSLRQFQGAYADAYSQARAAAERVPLTKEALEQANKDVSVSVARYRAGEATIIEVTDAQTRLATQRTALNTALYDYQVGLVRLRQAVGP